MGFNVSTSVRLSKWLIEGLDDLVKQGTFTNRSEAMRIAVKRLLAVELIVENTNKEQSQKYLENYQIQT